MNKLTALIEAAKAATPGPWREGTPPPNGTTTVGTLQGLMTAHCFNGQDSNFIALANPATILELCALLETCEAALLEAEDFCSAKHVGFQNLDDALAAIKQWKGE